ncbi:polysaccharide deacetylase family protein [Enterococcus sp. AZ109]|uniref:polysaccharide deacetylase family protein n=1 Tax=Enterococcus sp. AZ109 TaxID=2774634 RepID=UPI003F270E58
MHSIRLTFPNGCRKAVTLSYDDGKESDRKMIQLMNTYGLKGTFNLSAEKFSQKGSFLDYIEAKEVAALYNGHEVACHTYNHATTTLLPKQELISEILANRTVLENLVHYPVRGFAYPMGVFSEEVKNTLAVCGLDYARTTRTTNRFDLPNDLFEWSATCHHNEDLMERTNAFILRDRPTVLSLFYLWGHSYEFEEQNNWALFEAFCKKISGQKDIWFATNIEIVDYLEAFRRLYFAADNSFVVNPSNVAVSLLVNENSLISVDANETVFLNGVVCSTEGLEETPI